MANLRKASQTGRTSWPHFGGSIKVNRSSPGNSKVEIKKTKSESFGQTVLPTWKALGLVLWKEENTSPKYEEIIQNAKAPCSRSSRPPPPSAQGFLNSSTSIYRGLAMCQMLCRCWKHNNEEASPSPQRASVSRQIPMLLFLDSARAWALPPSSPSIASQRLIQ